MLDIPLLKTILDRSAYRRLARHIPRRVFNAQTLLVIDSFGKYFDSHPEATVIDPDQFSTWFKVSHPKLTPDAAAVWHRQLLAIKSPADSAVTDGIHDKLLAADLAFEMTSILDTWQAGEEIDLASKFQTAYDSFVQATRRRAKSPWIEATIDSVLDDEDEDSGLNWPLPTLDSNIRTLRAGDFIVFAARPDRGKTSFLAYLLTHFAPQIDRVWPGENRCILWLNNEGMGKRVKGRVYQAALKMGTEEMIAARDRGGSAALQKQYLKAIGGRDMVMVRDVHSASTLDIEAMLKEVDPALIVFDMLDNIDFGQTNINGGTRTDQFLESMYKWARVLGVTHDCAVIATSQVSGEGSGVPFPTQEMLKDSKTGKQGTADAIIMLGHTNDPNMEAVRWLSLPKNKLRRQSGRAVRLEVLFDQARSIFSEVS